MSRKPDSDKKSKQPQQREPISLAPLDFEEALAGLLQTGPHPKEQDVAKEGTEKPLANDSQRYKIEPPAE